MIITTDKTFPIQDGPSIPWAIIAPWESQAQRNHGQSLQQLADRGGLGVLEVIDVLTGQRYGTTNPGGENEKLLQIIRDRSANPRAEAAEARAARMAEAIEPLAHLEITEDRFARINNSNWPTKLEVEAARAALSASDAQAGALWIGQTIADLLKSMCDGQGDAGLFVSWDSATGDPRFDIIFHREREGEILERQLLSEPEFVALITTLKGEPK